MKINHDKYKIGATVIKDTISIESGNRITTILATFPRFILAEVNTHRAFSRNSASSRAIPAEKMIAMVEKHPFIPQVILQAHKGMQGKNVATDGVTQLTKHQWLEARDTAVYHAKNLVLLGVSKQLINRLLEPFMWHTALITATEWENFLALRTDAQAEDHFQILAKDIAQVLNESIPDPVGYNGRHYPFADFIDKEREDYQWLAKEVRNPMQVICTARCARVSYLNYDGKVDYKKDLALYQSLIHNGHWSPFEHLATCIGTSASVGNLIGWRSTRQDHKDENRRFYGLKKNNGLFSLENKRPLFLTKPLKVPTSATDSAPHSEQRSGESSDSQPDTGQS